VYIESWSRIRTRSGTGPGKRDPFLFTSGAGTRAGNGQGVDRPHGGGQQLHISGHCNRPVIHVGPNRVVDVVDSNRGTHRDAVTLLPFFTAAFA